MTMAAMRKNEFYTFIMINDKIKVICVFGECILRITESSE